MKLQKWPFRPKHITNDSENIKLKDLEHVKFASISKEYLKTLQERKVNLQKLNGPGIISNAHLEGLQTTICANLGNPTTIIEFSPKGEPVRTDSKLLFFEMHEPCKVFRDYTKEKVCLACDNCHAMLFYNIKKKENLIKTINNRLRKPEFEFISENIEKGIYFKIITHPQRPYLEYNCPLLGYRELVFPIIFEQRVIAVFFVGQLCLEDELKKISLQQEGFFTKPPDILQKYCSNKNLIAEIAQNVKNVHKKWINDQSHILKQKDYEEFISRAISELDNLERIIDEQIQLERDKYIRKHVDVLIKDFRKTQEVNPFSSDKKWELLWGNTDKRLKQIIDMFAIRYIIMFANKSPELQFIPQLNVVSKAGDIPQELSDLIDSQQLKFDLAKIKPEIRDTWVSSEMDKEVFSAIKGWEDYNDNTNLIRIFPVPFFPQASLAVLVGYKKSNSLTSVENRPSGNLSEALQSFYMVVLSTLSSVLADSSEARLKTTMRVLHHEINNSIQVLYQRMPRVVKQIPKETIGRKEVSLGFKNIEEGLKLLEQHTIWPQFLTGTYIVDLTKVPVLGMMHKWKDFFIDEIHARHLTVKVPSTDDPDHKHPKPLADARFLEYALSNLIKNAVKYAYDGTIIDLDSYKTSEEEAGKVHKIIVSNYGFEIKSYEKKIIYELFYRTHIAEEMTGKDDGQGAGLFVVKSCIEVHHWPFELPDSEFVTKFCAPIMYWLEKNNTWNIINNKKLREEAKEEYNLRREQITPICSDTGLHRKYNFMIEKALIKDTYKNVFKLIIPDWEKY